jgi:hypothetical protein
LPELAAGVPAKVVTVSAADRRRSERVFMRVLEFGLLLLR